MASGNNNSNPDSTRNLPLIQITPDLLIIPHLHTPTYYSHPHYSPGELAASFYSAFNTVWSNHLRVTAIQAVQSQVISNNIGGDQEEDGDEQLLEFLNESEDSTEEGDEDDGDEDSYTTDDDEEDTTPRGNGGDRDPGIAAYHRVMRQLFSVGSSQVTPRNANANTTNGSTSFSSYSFVTSSSTSTRGSCAVVLGEITPKMVVHAVNTLGILRRYLLNSMEVADRNCLYRPEMDEAIKFHKLLDKERCCPLDDLKPQDFDCRTKLIVIIRDRKSKTWGSHWTSLLWNAIHQETRMISTCFTFRSQPCVPSLSTLLHSIPPIPMKVPQTQGNRMVERFVTMEALTRILRYWSVPLLLLDHAPKGILDFKGILKFAKRFGIKVVIFGAKEKSIGDKEGDISIDVAKDLCSTKAREIGKIVKEAYERDVKEKEDGGFRSVQALIALEKLEEIHTTEEGKKKRPVDWNEWLEYEQPYYDIKEKERQLLKREAEHNEGHGSNKPEGPNENSVGQQGRVSSPSLIAHQSSSSQSSPLFSHPSAIDGDSEMPGLKMTQDSTEDVSLMRPTSSTASLTDGTASSNYLSSAEDSEGETLDPEGLLRWNPSPSSTSIDGSLHSILRHRRKTTSRMMKGLRAPPSVRYAKKIKEIEELKENLNNQGTPTTGPPDVLRKGSSQSSNSRPTSAELREILKLQETAKEYYELQQLHKYFLKMKKDLRIWEQNPNNPINNAPVSHLDFTLAERFNEGKSCVMQEVKEDEFELYRKPIEEVLSPNDIAYLAKDIPNNVMQHRLNVLGSIVLQATSLFVEIVLQFCCGSRLLPPPLQTERKKTLIFIHDNSDVLELLTGALWFAGNTVVATCQRNYYDRHKYFQTSLIGCQFYTNKGGGSTGSKEDLLKDEDLYLTWTKMGLHQALNQHDVRFIIIDFPRPGRDLQSTFEKMVKYCTQTETLYVTKSEWRGDNLATVENLLDQLQERMGPEERIIFRKSRKVYLDLNLSEAYEKEVKQEMERDRDWGLPKRELMDQNLWESIKLFELQMSCKSLKNVFNTSCGFQPPGEEEEGIEDVEEPQNLLMNGNSEEDFQERINNDDDNVEVGILGEQEQESGEHEEEEVLPEIDISSPLCPYSSSEGESEEEQDFLEGSGENETGNVIKNNHDDNQDDQGQVDSTSTPLFPSTSEELPSIITSDTTAFVSNLMSPEVEEIAETENMNVDNENENSNSNSNSNASAEGVDLQRTGNPDDPNPNDSGISFPPRQNQFMDSSLHTWLETMDNLAWNARYNKFRFGKQPGRIPEAGDDGRLIGIRESQRSHEEEDNSGELIIKDLDEETETIKNLEQENERVIDLVVNEVISEVVAEVSNPSPNHEGQEGHVNFEEIVGVCTASCSDNRTNTKPETDENNNILEETTTITVEHGSDHRSGKNSPSFRDLLSNSNGVTEEITKVSLKEHDPDHEETPVEEFSANNEIPEEAEKVKMTPDSIKVTLQHDREHEYQHDKSLDATILETKIKPPLTLEVEALPDPDEESRLRPSTSTAIIKRVTFSDKVEVESYIQQHYEDEEISSDNTGGGNKDSEEEEEDEDDDLVGIPIPRMQSSTELDNCHAYIPELAADSTESEEDEDPDAHSMYDGDLEEIMAGTASPSSPRTLYSHDLSTSVPNFPSTPEDEIRCSALIEEACMMSNNNLEEDGGCVVFQEEESLKDEYTLLEERMNSFCENMEKQLEEMIMRKGGEEGRFPLPLSPLPEEEEEEELGSSSSNPEDELETIISERETQLVDRLPPPLLLLPGEEEERPILTRQFEPSFEPSSKSTKSASSSSESSTTSVSHRTFTVEVHYTKNIPEGGDGRHHPVLVEQEEVQDIIKEQEPSESDATEEPGSSMECLPPTSLRDLALEDEEEDDTTLMSLTTTTGESPSEWEEVIGGEEGDSVCSSTRKKKQVKVPVISVSRTKLPDSSGELVELISEVEMSKKNNKRLGGGCSSSEEAESESDFSTWSAAREKSKKKKEVKKPISPALQAWLDDVDPDNKDVDDEEERPNNPSIRYIGTSTPSNKNNRIHESIRLLWDDEEKAKVKSQAIQLTIDRTGIRDRQRLSSSSYSSPLSRVGSLLVAPIRMIINLFRSKK